MLEVCRCSTVLQGPQYLPILWSHIPNMAMVSDTSNRPQDHVGDLLLAFSKKAPKSPTYIQAANWASLAPVAVSDGIL